MVSQRARGVSVRDTHLLDSLYVLSQLPLLVLERRGGHLDRAYTKFYSGGLNASQRAQNCSREGDTSRRSLRPFPELCTCFSLSEMHRYDPVKIGTFIRP